jgi:hypothetical protein
MVSIDTGKVFATCSPGLPAATAASTLNLGSFESVEFPVAGQVDFSRLPAAHKLAWAVALVGARV